MGSSMGEDLALGRESRPEGDRSELAGDSRFRQRFACESRIAAGLEHPNVVSVYGAGEETGRLFIAMRLRRRHRPPAASPAGRARPARAVRLVARCGGRSTRRTRGSRAPRHQARERPRRRRFGNRAGLPHRLRAHREAQRGTGSRRPGNGWGRLPTWRRSRFAASRSTRASICMRSAPSSIRR